MKSRSPAEEDWERYRARERAAIAEHIGALGFVLEDEQPHIAGERFLMHALTTASGRKLILLGRRTKDGARVVIKATSDAGGARELEHERACRELLHRIRFAYQVFQSPEEILFTRLDGYTIAIQAFIEQEMPFLARPLGEQFALALKALKAQEGAQVTTYGHERPMRTSFGIVNAKGYRAQFDEFIRNIRAARPDGPERALLERAARALAAGEETIERYGGFLTHTDFVPHNFRVAHGAIYLLDHSSLRFGNKYEGWARFLNFMALHNPALETALLEYVRLNRVPEETRALRLMRLYRLGEILWYYVNTLSKCSGDLRLLNEERVRFWTQMLEATLDDRPLDPSIFEAYRATRDRLRSPEENLRQQGLH